MSDKPSSSVYRPPSTIIPASSPTLLISHPFPSARTRTPVPPKSSFSHPQQCCYSNIFVYFIPVHTNSARNESPFIALFKGRVAQAREPFQWNGYFSSIGQTDRYGVLCKMNVCCKYGCRAMCSLAVHTISPERTQHVLPLIRVLDEVPLNCIQLPNSIGESQNLAAFSVVST